MDGDEENLRPRPSCPSSIILALGAANVYRKAVWRDVTDGITWKATGSGLRAIRVDPASEAFLRAGLRKGDILTAINKVPVADADRRPQEPLAGRGDRPERHLPDQQGRDADLSRPSIPGSGPSIPSIIISSSSA
ncbi:MAG: hypothetical protein M0C28_15390 [Candidatus Moduliflexus flocculans]|nr:hypothetical protein [Candidatus Moduliflexus flocculans]